MSLWLPTAGLAPAVRASMLVALLGWTACTLDSAGLTVTGRDASAVGSGGRGGGTASGTGGDSASSTGGGAGGAAASTGGGAGGAAAATGGTLGSSGGTSGSGGGTLGSSGGTLGATGGAASASGGTSGVGGSAGLASADAGSDGARPDAGGSGGVVGAAGATGAAGRGAAGASGLGPSCDNITTVENETPAKGVACTQADTRLCYRPCGPSDGTAEVGSKTETCMLGQYAEGDCLFPRNGDYACFAIPVTISRACPATTPRDATACSVASCTLCNNNGLYMDGSGTTKMGYCVCMPAGTPGAGLWSCASTNAWPCPDGQGC